MRKSFKYLTVFIVSLMVFAPLHIRALSISEFQSNNFQFLVTSSPSSNSNGITSTDEVQGWMDDYNQEQDCSGSNSILGDPNDEDSVAWLLQQILNYIKVIGPILVVILSSIDFAKVIVKSDDEAMAKAQKKLGLRLIFAAMLFFIPTLVQALLDIFGITSDPTCGLK